MGSCIIGALQPSQSPMPAREVLVSGAWQPFRHSSFVLTPGLQIGASVSPSVRACVRMLPACIGNLAAFLHPPSLPDERSWALCCTLASLQGIYSSLFLPEAAGVSCSNLSASEGLAAPLLTERCWTCMQSLTAFAKQGLTWNPFFLLLVLVIILS